MRAVIRISGCVDGTRVERRDWTIDTLRYLRGLAYESVDASPDAVRLVVEYPTASGHRRTLRLDFLPRRPFLARRDLTIELLARAPALMRQLILDEG